MFLYSVILFTAILGLYFLGLALSRPQVPIVKRSLETLIYRVKLMLDNNECVNSFEQGNLKHRELDGREVSSQPDDSETDDDDHEEDDDYEELS